MAKDVLDNVDVPQYKMQFQALFFVKMVSTTTRVSFDVSFFMRAKC